MATAWTTEQIIGLAPDASSAKSGRDLASPRKWLSLGRTEQLLWGLCQGSGKNPYQTCIDLTEPAFKCTCPSRKFPCKHSLGLFLIYAAQPAAAAAGEPPPWVAEWISKRAQREEKKTAKAAGETQPAPDPEAQAKRAADREEKVRAGLEELSLWLRDGVRQGLAALQAKPPSFWQTMAARMVDAQAPGLSRQVERLAEFAASGEGWTERLLAAMSRLHLLCASFPRIASLPEPNQADLRAAIGWPVKQDEILAQEGLRDEWCAVAQRVMEEDRLRVQRTWLQGRAGGRAAMILQFAHAAQPLDASLVPGTSFRGDLVFFPGGAPLRALVKQREPASSGIADPPGYPDAEEALAAYGNALAANPWLELFPMTLRAVRPVRDGADWVLRDESGVALPVSNRFKKGWELLAASGGNAIAVSGEWDGGSFFPLSLWAGRFIRL